MSFADRALMRETSRELTPAHRVGDVVLGDDWVAPETSAEREMRDKRARRGPFSLRSSLQNSKET